MNAIEKQQEKFVGLPVPNWKRSPLPINIFEKTIGKAHIAMEGEHTKLHVGPIKDLFTNDQYSTYAKFWTAKGSKAKSLGEKFESYISGFSPDGLFILSKAKSFEAPRLKLSYFFNEIDVNYLLEQLIVAEEGSKLEVILDLSSAENMPLNYFGQTKIVAKSGAFVKVTKIQRLSNKANAFDLNLSIVEEGGRVEVVDVQIGADYKAVSYESELMGNHSQSEMKSVYYGEGSQKLDLSYTMAHGGKQSESSILAKGVLADESQKVFRGNLFFHTGSSESIGREQEFLTLLSPRVTSDSFPALMCSEDDVIGEHAASIGQIDLEKMFYLMSRGLSEMEAKRLLIKASFEEIVRTVGDEALEGLIMAEVDRRLV